MNRRSALRWLGGGLAGGVLGGVGLRSSAVALPLRASASVDHAEDAPVRLTATVTEPHVRPGSSARLRLSLENVSERTVAHESGLPAPFGVLSLAGRVDVATLWTDAYEAESGVTTAGGRVRAVAEVLKRRELAPGERVAEEYAIRPSEPLLRPGTFAVTSFGNETFSRRYGEAVSLRVSLAPG